MLFIQFVMDEPVVASLLLLVLLLVGAVIASIWQDRRKKAHPDAANVPQPSSQNSRFLGTQVDLAILLVGLLLLAFFVAWLKELISG